MANKKIVSLNDKKWPVNDIAFVCREAYVVDRRKMVVDGNTFYK